MKRPIRDLSLDELKDIFVEKNIPPYRAKQVMGWVYGKQALEFSEMKNLPKDLLAKLDKEFLCSTLSLVEVKDSSDNSKKFLFKTSHGEYVESVYIHQGAKRHALCLSTQVGCKMGCKFCASGKLGWERNLSAGEILDQVAHVMRDLQAPINNIIYMGMGEPLDNVEAVLKSIKGLRADWGHNMGWRRITVSTSGVVPAMREFANQVSGEVKLAVSLHATTDETREKIMPINKAYPLGDLMGCLDEIKYIFKRQLTFEYILIKGLNDSMEDAQRLKVMATQINAKVNLIPYNTIEGESFERPSKAVMDTFQSYLEDEGVTATLRYSAGDDITAACGQLRLKKVQG
jgi:23S rRNA (adenine2503-C2)-methyltransferase